MAGYFVKRHVGNDGRILLHAYERAECAGKNNLFVQSCMLALLHGCYIGQATYLNCLG